MNLHEYQAKELFERYGIPVPKGKLADQPNHACEHVEPTLLAAPSWREW